MPIGFLVLGSQGIPPGIYWDLEEPGKGHFSGLGQIISPPGILHEHMEECKDLESNSTAHIYSLTYGLPQWRINEIQRKKPF